MDTITFIVEAPTLIARIHGLKQWIYNGSIRVVVPICTLEEVEKQYQASLISKEPPKEPAAKRASGRAPRREEHPLFDINPRTAWEFLCRVQSVPSGTGISFQKEGEEFSQWKSEYSRAKLAESVPVAPSSFADALLRKLNIAGGKENGGTNGISDHKVVSRTSDSNSPGKHQKVPTIPSDGVPSHLKSFFSYALWRIHESEPDALRQPTCMILTDDVRVKSIAAILDIQIRGWAELQKTVADQLQAQDYRSTVGRVETDFSMPRTGLPDPATTDSSGSARPDVLDRGPAEDEKGPEVSLAQSVAIYDDPKDTKPWTASKLLSASAQELALLADSATPQNPLPRSNGSSDQSDTVFEIAISAAQKTSRPVPSNPSPPVSSGGATDPEHGKTAAHSGTLSHRPFEVSDVDSDEEIIVFNPRSKRLSGRPRTPGGPSEPSSRPATAGGPTTGHVESPQPPRSPYKFTLKPQSPVFTPGQLYAAQNGQQDSFSGPTNDAQPDLSKSPPRSPHTSHVKPTLTKGAGSNPKPKTSHTDEARRQQSELIIQRQREAMQRQPKSSTKAPPRKVQMEPTNNPTIIDPDAFDRSYIVQPPSQNADRGGKKRSGTRQRPISRGSPLHANGQDSAFDDDFVLKSGAPRGSMRGKGKLFVP